jgi:beta-phosphoglucomutase
VSLPPADRAVDAVVFDFDGVLADTERLHLGAFQEVFGRRGWPLSEAAYFSRYLGHGDEALLDEYARDHDHVISPTDATALLDEKSDAFRRRLSAAGVLYPGAAACVTRLVSEFALAIASGALRAEITDVLAAHHLLTAFPVIVAIEDVARGKPDPEPFQRAAARLGVEPARCVAIEDSRWGLTAARAAGMRTIGITTTSTAADLAHADALVSTLDEITVARIQALGARGPRVVG